MTKYTFHKDARLVTFKSREDWLKRRTKVITATSAGAIMGYSPWETKMDIYMRLTRGVVKETEETEAIRKGNQFEPIARLMFAVNHPEWVLIEPPKNNWMIVRKDKPWFGATPDGILIKDGKVVGGVECKRHQIRGKQDEENWKEGKLPNQYYIQVLHTGNAMKCDIYYLIAILEYQKKDEKTGEWVFDHIEYREYFFDFTEKKEELAYEEEEMEKFYQNNVKAGVMPALEL